MTSISLVICTYQRPQAIVVALDSVLFQSRPPDEIIVVDSSEDNQTELAISSHELGPSITYIMVDESERGLTRQRNRGISLASMDVVAFIDDDVVLEPDYILELGLAFDRHPEAVGIGGSINGQEWLPPEAAQPKHFVVEGWGTKDSFRWRVRRYLHLDSPLPPGWMPASGHGRSASYPPTGKDYQVEFIMGGVSGYRRDLFNSIQFSPWFEGYGLYEDLDFSTRASRLGSLYLSTKVRLDHYHEPSGRPDHVKYGRMVVTNGWRVWRTRWPMPSLKDRAKWWLTTLLLIVARALGPGDRKAAMNEALGRLRAIPLVARAEFSPRVRARLLASER